MEFTMSVKNNQCVVTSSVDNEDKQSFVAISRGLGIPTSALIRRLIQYFLDKKISWSELFGQNDELSVVDSSDNSKRTQMRTTLSSEQYSVFARRVAECGSTTTIVVRRLILLYVTGKIERGDIWY
jgi:hypothetical protein